MEQQNNTSKVALQTRFPELEIDAQGLEKSIQYHGAHFGIRALEYVVFIGTLITLGIFTAAFFQIVRHPSGSLYVALAAVLLAVGVFFLFSFKNRLMESLGTAISGYGIIAWALALFEWEFRENTVEWILMLTIGILVFLVRKNLITILGTIALFWLTYVQVNDYRDGDYVFKAYVVGFILSMALFIAGEEWIFKRFTRFTHFVNYLKNGLFFSLSLYFIFFYENYFTFYPQKNHTPMNWLIYGEVIALGIGLFVWQFKRLKAEHLSWWMMLLIPLCLLAVGMLNTPIVFFLMTFLAFLFTRSLFGSILAGIGLIYAVIHFYYVLEWTLMQKSLAFIGLGVLFLGMFFLMNLKKTNHE